MTQTTFQKDIFQGATAVVTGGTSGIGAATAIYLAELGAKVHALGLKADLLKVPAGLDVKGIEMDVTDESAVKKLF